jgi:L-ribulose-5-phosphate 4-epimerase
MYEKLKKDVYKANMELSASGLVIYTWGNVSSIDRAEAVFAIKPSGVSYEGLKWEDIPVLDMDGNVIEGKLKPSSDTATHLALYLRYEGIGGVVHAHPMNSTSFAQAGKPVPALGTTHADYFYGGIPCTRDLTKEEIESDYELNTGRVIIETLGDNDPLEVPAILVKNHGPFAWGEDPFEAVHNAVVMEYVAEMAYRTVTLKSDVKPVQQFLLDKHYFRKHGAQAYYGQT